MYPVRLCVGESGFVLTVFPASVLSALLLMAALATPAPAAAQSNQTPEISGLLFADYDYTVTSPHGELDGRNGFGYRRVYFTVDYPVSERIVSRVRFEARDSRTTADGLPEPFVKDLFLRLGDFPASGHSATFGLHPTPNFRVSEDVWGYRSLERTVQDRADVVDSRDIGISFTGPVTNAGSVRYRFMFGNNSGIRPETDKFKRVYGAVEFRPQSPIRAAVGGDYYQFDVGTSTNVFAFVGVETSAAAAGVEIFSNEVRYESGPEPVTSGVSVFGRFTHADNRTLVGRIDLTGVSGRRLSTDIGYAVIGYAFGIDDRVEIIPNVEYWFSEGSEDGMLRARLTVSARL